MFHSKDIDNSIADYDIDDEVINSFAPKSMGVDPGFGSSAFGIVVTRFVDGRAQVLFADENERPDYDEMLKKCSAFGWNIGENRIENSMLWLKQSK